MDAKIIKIKIDRERNIIYINGSAWGIQAIEHLIMLRKAGKIVESRITDTGIVRKIQVDKEIVDYAELTG